MSSAPIPRVLSIAGTDPSGGAGIQADLKSIAANGGYGMAAVTALVAQNTHGVRSIHVPPVAFLREQLDAVSDDVEIDAVKIGMLGTTQIVRTVESWLIEVRPPIVVLDPVMVATSGDRLLDAEAEAALAGMLPLVDLVTPNLAELAVLAGLAGSAHPRSVPPGSAHPSSAPARDWAGALAQARRVSERWNVIVLVKGGHLGTDASPDALVDGATLVEFPGVRVDTRNTHGTGCSLSSAMATLQARNHDWAASLRQAKAWLTESLLRSEELHVGSGNGPVHHFAGLYARAGLSDAETEISAATTPAQITGDWWDAIAGIRDGIDALPFVTGLADGTLERDDFLAYLAQDALYLRDYARVLARASQLAPTSEEQAFWATSASGSILGELELHREWLGGEPGATFEAHPVTTAYLNHLAAAGAGTSYPVLVAALLPCFWLYQDAGERLHTRSHPGHPYASWLDTYADPAFRMATDRAIAIVGRAAASAPTAERDAMRRAFSESARHELAFFAMFPEAPDKPSE
ncbi:bifunctional hydroxymethylpyrimidine kinase/phosphomethylpyrimidine kinase [Compostimonas suwonensis]|uniref:Hydroxymethylpyrimidine/phosphomethylpyrimidine kinase n=1 Tax=Compostimonas suwonensis TaxID=1048394 RepID=A0A2M9BU57_9MICO|nr:bifunctional hydroxymethylpyrimidine kinase/phosphomethylpyrimidine kinase [Compostimonas suwonensis]PJJ61461.1 hydroxymethylpyrimidine/phosphomethylpyrimidine kinase [Compostimonas suwonensis]